MCDNNLHSITVYETNFSYGLTFTTVSLKFHFIIYYYAQLAIISIIKIQYHEKRLFR